MANHKSSLKRIRQDKKKAEHNHYYAKTMRNASSTRTRLPTSSQACVLTSASCKKHLTRLKSIKSREPNGLRLFCCLEMYIFCSFLALKA